MPSCCNSASRDDVQRGGAGGSAASNRGFEPPLRMLADLPAGSFFFFCERLQGVGEECFVSWLFCGGGAMGSSGSCSEALYAWNRTTSMHACDA
jgi:hypothetical protein